MLKIIGKIAVTLGCVLFMVSALVPPWQKIYPASQHKQVIPIGFYCVFTPPKQMAPVANADGSFNLWDAADNAGKIEPQYSIAIDFARLILIWIAIATVTSAGLLLARKSSLKD